MTLPSSAARAHGWSADPGGGDEGELSEAGHARATQDPDTQVAVAELFDEHADLVFRFLRALGLPPHQAEDALQDVFVIVHEKLPTFEGRSKMSTWICGIARKVALNQRRKAARRGGHEELDEATIGAGQSPEEQAGSQQAVRKIQGFSETLSEGMREVFVLCFLEEMRAPEVAEILEVPLPTVYSRVRLLRAALTELLEEGSDDGTK